MWRRERAASESCELLMLKPSRSCRRPETSSAWRARSAETTRWTPTHFMSAFYTLHPVCQIHCHFAGSGSRLVMWSDQKPPETRRADTQHFNLIVSVSAQHPGIQRVKDHRGWYSVFLIMSLQRKLVHLKMCCLTTACQHRVICICKVTGN